MDFAAYFDESGTHAGSEIVAVAGVLSTPDRWAVLTGEWRKVLAMHGLEFFHMTEYETRQGQYAEWSNPRRLSVIRHLSGIIRRFTFMSMAAAIVMPDYDALDQEAKEILGPPYVFCATWCMRWIAGFAEMVRPKAVIDYTFEGGADGIGQLTHGWEQQGEENRSRYRLRGLTVGEKRTDVPLQVADIMAYEARKQVPRAMGTEVRPVRQSLVNLARGLTLNGNYFDTPTLQAVVAKMRKDYAELMTKSS